MNRLLTKKTLKALFEPIIGQKLWGIRENIGSSIKFEFGKEIEEGRGEYHFWIFCAHWWLERGSTKTYQDIVHSSSSQENIKEKIKILEGKKLLNVEFDLESGNTFFDFDDDLFLETASYSGSDPGPQWELFTPTYVLSVGANGQYEYENVTIPS